MSRGRAWRRHKNIIKRIRNFKRRYYSWISTPMNNDELDTELTWHQGIGNWQWQRSLSKAEGIKYKDTWYSGDYPIKKYYRAKIKEIERKELHREIYQQ